MKSRGFQVRSPKRPCLTARLVIPQSVSARNISGKSVTTSNCTALSITWFISVIGFPVDDDTARETLLANLDGEALAEPRPLRFVTGRRKALWDKNVVSLGLSSGFIEPLESTSIHLVQVGIFRLLQHWPDLAFSQTNTKAYNRRLVREIEMVRDFVILHYHATDRDDTPFWRYVRDMPIPDSLAERVELFRDRGLMFQVGADEYFQATSWLAVMYGQGIVPRTHNPLYDYQNPDQVAAGLEQLRRGWAATAEALPTHEAFLKSQSMWAMDTVAA